MAVVFETKGLIDPRAFTTMGLSAKPNSANPIGYFGTGLKYAVAVLTRLGAKPVVWIGTDKYKFEKIPAQFRGVPFEQIRMEQVRRGWRSRYQLLPYTTQYGRNWQAWQAFRELQSNTVDEGGTTYEALADNVEGQPDTTKIVIDLPAFDDAYRDRDAVFLPNAQRTGTGIQVVDREGNSLFWRGLKVYETSKRCLYTYNFLDDMWLTEDRTLAGEWQARSTLGRWLVQRCRDEGIIERIVTVSDTYFEHSIEYDSALAPSAEFHRVMLRNKRANAPAWGYYSIHDLRKPTVDVKWSLWGAHPRPWTANDDSILDANGGAVFGKPSGYVGSWELAAAAIIELTGAGRHPDTVDLNDVEEETV